MFGALTGSCDMEGTAVEAGLWKKKVMSERGLSKFCTSFGGCGCGWCKGGGSFSFDFLRIQILWSSPWHLVTPNYYSFTTISQRRLSSKTRSLGHSQNTFPAYFTSVYLHRPHPFGATRSPEHGGSYAPCHASWRQGRNIVNAHPTVHWRSDDDQERLFLCCKDQSWQSHWEVLDHRDWDRLAWR